MDQSIALGSLNLSSKMLKSALMNIGPCNNSYTKLHWPEKVLSNQPQEKGTLLRSRMMGD
jgi:hypothetical protein